VTAVLDGAALELRHRHQQQVAALLDEIEERRRQVYRLQAGGVSWAGMRDLKADLGSLRAELADAVGQASAPARSSSRT